MSDFVWSIDAATGLRVRTVAALERAWFPLRVPDDLPFTSDDDLRSIRNIGWRTLDEIRDLYPYQTQDDEVAIRERLERCG